MLSTFHKRSSIHGESKDFLYLLNASLPLFSIFPLVTLVTMPLVTHTVVHMAFDYRFFFCINFPCWETGKHEGQTRTSNYVQKFVSITAELLNKSELTMVLCLPKNRVLA